MKHLRLIGIIFSILLISSFVLFPSSKPQSPNGFDPNEGADDVISQYGTRATLRVGSTQTYSTIQSAIDAANPGDTIIVDSGTYLEHVLVNKTLDLKGNSSNRPIIDGWGAGIPIYVTSSGCNVTDFNVTGSPSGINYFGALVLGGINNFAQNITAYSSKAGIYFGHSSRNSISNCVSKDNTYGLFLHNSQINNITDCTFENNTNSVSSWARASWKTKVNNSIFRKNINGVKSVGSSFEITNSSFISNSGYAIEFINGYSSKILNNNFINNNNQSGGRQASAGSGSIWDQDGYGNYWSDWTTPDADLDGIVDDPYVISGSVQDNFPLTRLVGKPVITAQPVPIAFEDVYYEQQYTVFNLKSPGGNYIWSFDSNASWLDFSAFQVLYGTPENQDVGIYWVNITVTDGSNSDFINFTIEVFNVNDPPVILNLNNETANEDVNYRVQYLAQDIDPGPNILTWSLNTTAPFLVMNTSTGILNGTPNNSQVGIWDVSIVLDDSEGGVDGPEFQLQVLNINDAPVIHGVANNHTMEDEPYNVQFNVADIDENNTVSDIIFTWSLVKGPGFLSIDRYNGRLSGIPLNSHVGLHLINISVEDDAGGKDWYEYELRVENVNDAPKIITQNYEVCTEHELYQVQYDAIDIDPANNRLSWWLNTDCKFLELNLDTGLLTGTPAQEDIGKYSVNISVEDGQGGSDWTIFELTVQEVNDPVSGKNHTIKLMEDEEKTSYDLDEMFTDPEGADLQIVSSTPKNINISGNKNIMTFKPDADWNGWENLTIVASDGKYAAKAELRLYFEPVNDPPSSVEIRGIKDGAEIANGTLLNLAPVIKDPDLDREGDVYKYLWSVNKIAMLGTNKTLDSHYLSPGNYSITLLIKDSGGKSAETTIDIRVIANKVQPEPEVKEPKQKEKDLRWLYLVISLAGLILVFCLLMFYVKRLSNRKKKEMRNYKKNKVKRKLKRVRIPVEKPVVEEFEIIYSYYELLDIPRDATEKMIKKAYREKSKQSHPDAGGDNDEEEKERLLRDQINLNKAKGILLDREKRAQYDKHLGIEDQEQFGNDEFIDVDDVILSQDGSLGEGDFDNDPGIEHPADQEYDDGMLDEDFLEEDDW